eukprot:TRINITY_DN76404_c0_g1_i1.p1 TRINITY_DN76404_c0_g1~~TRINITY_DN76404_c0_g1_i1.p1  ORF type:complete len:652 (+),score=174.07 TRINITY_DN76404_c0_g1_i1:116-2071(+)
MASGSDLFGLKRPKEVSSGLPQLGFEERADLLEDLLEDDVSSLPLLEAPREVLAAVGSFLDAPHLAALSELCRPAHVQLEEAFTEAWDSLLMRDHLPKNRAKRYQRGSLNSWASATCPTGAGLVLRALDISRVEWDGLLLAASPRIRYSYLQSAGVLRSRWGRLAQSWDWLSTRVLRRMTYTQLERLVPGFVAPTAETAEDGCDDVSHRAALDRESRKRHRECHHADAIASVKQKLGIMPKACLQEEAPTTQREESRDAAIEDELAALPPTARDQRLQAAAAAEVSATESSAAGAASQPSRETIERMSFSEQMELAMKISVASEVEDTASKVFKETPATVPAEEEQESSEGVLLRLAAPRLGIEPLEVVLRESSAGQEVGLPSQHRHNCEQMALKLTRADWLLLYESVAIEAQLRARTVAYHLRRKQPSGCMPVRLIDLEAVLLQLPIFGAQGATAAAAVAAAAAASEASASGMSEAVQEQNLSSFLETWREYEAWAASLEDPLGPLDLEVSRERTNNWQGGRGHTPYVVDLCRLAFRNFAICEGRLFIDLALGIYGLVAKLMHEDEQRCCRAPANSRSADAAAGLRLHEKTCEKATEDRLALLEALHCLTRVYSVQDDALAAQRNTLQEFRYYLLEPLQRACKHFDLLED